MQPYGKIFRAATYQSLAGAPEPLISHPISLEGMSAVLGLKSTLRPVKCSMSTGSRAGGDANGDPRLTIVRLPEKPAGT
jgi:hypothetical protein